MNNEIFVVWDFSTVGLKVTLEGLKERPPEGCVVDVPGLGHRGGSILFDVVLKGIVGADRVLVVTDRPNANVGFEAGLAIGFGKPVLFAHHGSELPEWSSVSPLSNVLQANFENLRALRSLVANENAWIAVEKSPKLPLRGRCLDLCPRRGEGDALREEREAKITHGWIRPPLTPFAITELNRRFDSSNRLVWTIASYPENADLRDGAENAANAILAGWFFARCRDYFDGDRREDMPFWVLRSASSRPVVDVALHEYEGTAFTSLDDYGRRLVEIEKAWRQRREIEKQQREARPRIAVLRFDNVDIKEGDEAFSDGLTEMLIDSLTGLTGLSIIPKTSVLNLSRHGLTTREIGQRLRADYLLEGSLDRTEDPCRITVRLIQTRDEVYIWSETKTEKWANVQRIRSEIVEAVAKQLRDVVGLEQLHVAVKEPERPIEATEHFMLGRLYLRRFNNVRRPDDLQASLEHFRSALELDAGYIDAQIQLGFLHILAWETDGSLERLSASEAIWEQVLTERPDEPFALVERAYITYVLHGKGLQAIERARRAVAEDLDSSLPFNVLALLYLYLGFWESTAYIESQFVIPRDPAYVYPRANTALAKQLMFDYEEAQQTATQIRALDRDAFVADILEGCQNFYQDRFEDARRIWQDGLERATRTVVPIFETLLAWLSARSGDRDRALEIIDRYRDAGELKGPYAPYYISLCALTGETELAIELLSEERTFASSYRYLVTEPTLRSLAKNSRFHDLLETRYYEWRRIIEQHGAGLPEAPPAVPSPLGFLGVGGLS